jgi:hypothetical protein
LAGVDTGQRDTPAALLQWGLATGSKALVYSLILPFIFAFMARDLVLRR